MLKERRASWLFLFCKVCGVSDLRYWVLFFRACVFSVYFIGVLVFYMLVRVWGFVKRITVAPIIT